MATETEGLTFTYDKYPGHEMAWHMRMELKRWLPDGIEDFPRTALEALVAGRAVLVDERKWTTSEWYSNAHPQVDPDDPFCNSWTACAEGAVALTTIGATRGQSEYKDPATMDGTRPRWPGAWCFRPSDFSELLHSLRAGGKAEHADELEKRLDTYKRAVNILHDTAIVLLAERGIERNIGQAYDYNDADFNTYRDVMTWFDRAIEAATAAKENSK